MTFPLGARNANVATHMTDTNRSTNDAKVRFLCRRESSSSCLSLKNVLAAISSPTFCVLLATIIGSSMKHSSNAAATVNSRDYPRVTSTCRSPNCPICSKSSSLDRMHTCRVHIWMQHQGTPFNTGVVTRVDDPLHYVGDACLSRYDVHSLRVEAPNRPAIGYEPSRNPATRNTGGSNANDRNRIRGPLRGNHRATEE